jgi:predicted  nucleic acid-binding Zn-ribbon protein
MNTKQNELKEKIFNLVKLQKHEVEVEHYNQKLVDIPKEMEALDKNLFEIDQTHQLEKESLKTLKKQYRDMENESKTILDQVKKSEDKLKAIKTNREYQSGLKEIDELQLKNSQYEDQMINYLDEIDEAEQSFSKREVELSEEKELIEVSRQEILVDEKDIKLKLDELENERALIVEQVDEALIDKYTLIKSKGIPTPVTAVINAACQGCYVNIPPQKFIELSRFEELTVCPHCERIIYAVKEE